MVKGILRNMGTLTVGKVTQRQQEFFLSLNICMCQSHIEAAWYKLLHARVSMVISKSGPISVLSVNVYVSACVCLRERARDHAESVSLSCAPWGIPV